MADSTPKWSHRIAWTLLCATFLLVYVGSTVTTYEAGMAVPDWPTTEGHWFYPIQQWLFGAWDLFLEHGHRLLAQIVGLLTIALAVAVWRTDPRRFMRWLVLLAIAGVISQGVLGGLRVIWELRLLAAIHACTAPLFLSLCAALVALTSHRWMSEDKPVEHPAAKALHAMTLAAVVAIYVEITFGAQLRHLPLDASPGWFAFLLWTKLILAGLIFVGVIALLTFVLKRLPDVPPLRIRAAWLVVAFAMQLMLGAGAWITNYGFPEWFTSTIWAPDYTIAAEGPLQVVVTTLHAAVGSLTLIAALSLALWSRRLMKRQPKSA